MMAASTLTDDLAVCSGAPLLLVEDDEPLRQMLNWELTDLGYQVCAASDCAGARQWVRSHPLRFALIDVRLPDGDGRALSAELAAELPALDIVLMSAAHDLRPAPEAGGNVLAFLGKPVNLARIHRVLATASGRTESTNHRLDLGADRVALQRDQERSLMR